MNKIYYVLTAVVLALAGLGIYASQAQNNDSNNNDGGVLIIEEDDYAVIPGNPNGTAPAGVNNNIQPNPAANNVNNKLNDVPASDLKPLPGDPGVDVAPDNQPVVDKAMKAQNPTYGQGVVVEEGVVEQAN